MLEIPKQYTSFEFIRPISWPEIFEVWRKNEEYQDSWKKHWQERGFDSWEQWRKAYAAPLTPETLKWFLYAVKDPVKNFPLIYGVPSRSWIKKAYNGEKTMLFKDLVKLPIISENPKVADIKRDFPKSTTLTGLIHNDTIILYEGIHRGAALADWNPSKPFKSKVFLALAHWDQKDFPIVGWDYKK